MFFYYVTLFLIPFDTHPILGYNLHGFTPIKVAGALAFGWAVLLVNNQQRPVQFPSRSRLYFGLVVAYLLYSMAAHGFNIGTDRLFWLVSILMFYVTTVTLVDTKDKLLTSCVVLLLTMAVSSAYMVRQYLQYGAIHEGFRPGGTVGDANYYSAVALAVLPVAYFLGKRSGSKVLSLFSLGSLAAIFAGLLVGQSRGGMLGLAAIMIVATYESSARIRTATFLCIAVFLVLTFSPINPLKRFLEADTASEGSTNAHILLVHAGAGMIRDYPLVGVGLGRFRSNSMAYADELKRPFMAHNSFLELAAENGIPLLILYLLMCLAVIKDLTNAKSLHERDRVTHGILTGMRLGIIGFLVSATFISAEYQKMFWVLCFLAMAMSRIGPKSEHTDSSDGLTTLASV